MALKLFYITNRPEVAVIADKNGVDRIWIDLEIQGKQERQKNMNTVKSNHRISDIAKIKPLLSRSELLVRVNPWNQHSPEEINAVIDAGADVIMLPMWKTVGEVQNFLSVVNGRIITTLLLETKEAIACLDEVLALDFDEIHIGLNDLHLSCGMDFMFELLADGTVEWLCNRIKEKGIPYGFGGIASLGKGLLASEKVMMEHYRLHSTRAILSRSFCNVDQCVDMVEVENRFRKNMKALRAYEKICEAADESVYLQNKNEVAARVKKIAEEMRENNKRA